AAAEDEGFGAAADAGVQRPDEHVVRPRFGQRLLAQLSRAGTLNPEGLFRVFLLSGDRRLVSPPYEQFAESTMIKQDLLLRAVVLLLDGLDGQVARRTGTASEFGARFDMEVDAFLILLLCVVVSRALGPWVLAIGLMRYVFVAASWAMPWLTASLYPSMARKS